MTFAWDEKKNRELKKARNVTFEDVITQIRAGRLVDVIKHPNQEKYPHQHIYLVCLWGYLHLVPFVKDGDTIFLKTIIPSRKMHRLYKGVCDEDG